MRTRNNTNYCESMYANTSYSYSLVNVFVFRYIHVNGSQKNKCVMKTAAPLTARSRYETIFGMKDKNTHIIIWARTPRNFYAYAESSKLCGLKTLKFFLIFLRLLFIIPPKYATSPWALVSNLPLRNKNSSWFGKKESWWFHIFRARKPDVVFIVGSLLRSSK